MIYRFFQLLLVSVIAVMFMHSATSQEQDKKSAEEPPPASEESPPEFTEEFLSSAENITIGEEVWEKQCRHCHGYSAYPGKAPKLKPRRYKPDFVYDRVTNGFRKMPGWKSVFSQQERMSVVAYILSKSFSP